jgi:hypothetical protein
MKNRSLSRCLIVAALTVIADKSLFGASVPIATFDPTKGQFAEPHGNGSVWGWTFLVKTPIIATDIGWYDEGGNGLSHEHRIGLWYSPNKTSWPYIDATATQLLSSFAVVPSGTSAELDGRYRKEPIPAGPLVLQPGGYALGGIDYADSTDSIMYSGDFPDNIPLAQGRAILGAPGYATQPGFRPPSLFFLVNGLELGPMLFVQPIPEPRAITVAMLPAIVLGSSLRMRRRTP